MEAVGRERAEERQQRVAIGRTNGTDAQRAAVAQHDIGLEVGGVFDDGIDDGHYATTIFAPDSSSYNFSSCALLKLSQPRQMSWISVCTSQAMGRSCTCC